MPRSIPPFLVAHLAAVLDKVCLQLFQTTTAEEFILSRNILTVDSGRLDLEENADEQESFSNTCDTSAIDLLGVWAGLRVSSES